MYLHIQADCQGNDAGRIRKTISRAKSTQDDIFLPRTNGKWFIHFFHYEKRDIVFIGSTNCFEILKILINVMPLARYKRLMFFYHVF